MFPPFSGARKPLDDLDIPMLSHRLDVGEDELRAFLDVEARSRGFDSQGRPVMLFEPHVFYRNLTDLRQREAAVNAGLAYPEWGEKPYPNESYTRLEEAVKINESAALMAASIGMSQVLVENYSSLGYESPQQMWQMFMDDEQEHVEAMVRFILVNGIADDLKAHRWAAVARVYNGPGYRKNNYDGKMAAAFKKFSGVPDLDWSPDGDAEGPGDLSKQGIIEIQKRLRDLGYVEVGKADGIWGTKLRAGVLAFRADNGLPIIPAIDDQFKLALIDTPKRAVAISRAETTVADLRQEGSRTVKASDQAEIAGSVVAALGVLTGVSEAFNFPTEDLAFLTGAVEKIEPLIDTIKTMDPIMLMVAGAYIVWQVWKVKKARVDDQRTGKNAGSP